MENRIYPIRSILHLDGDGFFAACEVAKNPLLRGKPVIVGKDRGIALALTYEAKWRGVKRGMLRKEAEKLCPEAIWLPMDFHTYVEFSKRMGRIVERYTTHVEHYSIDECFADISAIRSQGKTDEEIARTIKVTIQGELGMTFSFGVGPTKVLAKVASKWNKPDGLTIITTQNASEYLNNLPIEKIWGIGSATSKRLNTLGIHTAREFVAQDAQWVRSNFARPYYAIWQELQGISVLPFGDRKPKEQQSLMRTRTFAPTHEEKRVLSELANNIEIATMELRQIGLVARTVTLFTKTQQFTFHSVTHRLHQPQNTPEDILELIPRYAQELTGERTLYRATGVIFSELSDGDVVQQDLFGKSVNQEKLTKLHNAVDHLNHRYAKRKVHLATSMRNIVTTIDRHDACADALNLPFAGSV